MSSCTFIWIWFIWNLNRTFFFSPNILSLVNRGWIHVIGHVRGGSEKGWNWYLNPRKLQKKNSFTDFIDVAEYLISLRYARPNNIIIHGASPGQRTFRSLTGI